MQLQQRSQEDDGLIPNAASHVTTFQLPCTNSIQKSFPIPQRPQTTVSCSPCDLHGDTGALLPEAVVHPPCMTLPF